MIVDLNDILISITIGNMLETSNKIKTNLLVQKAKPFFLFLFIPVSSADMVRD
jgi:hypothetical protein